MLISILCCDKDHDGRSKEPDWSADSGAFLEVSEDEKIDDADPRLIGYLCACCARFRRSSSPKTGDEVSALKAMMAELQSRLLALGV